LSANIEPARAIVQPSEQNHSADIRTALWLGLALFFFYLLTTSGHLPYADEADYVNLAHNILTRGRLIIEQVELGPDGRPQHVLIYSRLPLGQSLLTLPFVFVALSTRELFPQALSFAAHLVINSLPAAESAATCALVFLLIRILGRSQTKLYVSPRTALTVTLTTALATQMWPASRTLFADTSAALLLTFAIYSLVRFRLTNAGAGWVLSAAWSAALAVLCKTVFILAAPALAAYGVFAVMRRNREQPLSCKSLVSLTILAFVLVVITQLWYNHYRYGSIWLSGYHERREGEFGFSTPLFAGLYGIFLSSGRSLFLYSPPCLLALFGARKFLNWAREEMGLVAGAALPLVFAYAKWWAWDGGWEWGNRFHLFLIPLLMWLGAPAWQWLDRRSLPAIVRRVRLVLLVALIAASIYVQGLGLLIRPDAYWEMVGSDEMSILIHRGYEKGIWDMRDNMLLAHFVPEFSPLAAHRWLVWATWNSSRLDDAALAAAAPWYSLNPKWAPKNVRPYLGFDLWFIEPWVSEETVARAAVIVIAAFLAVVVSLCIIKLKHAIDDSP
jgi:hypothetical protein